MKLKCIFIFYFLIGLLPCFSRDLLTVHENIVPTNNIYNVFFDRDGFMWIGSELGLARYDGTNVTIIKPDKHNVGVGAILQDDYGRIWCIGEHSLYYVEDDRLILVRSETKSEWVSSIMTFEGKLYLTRGLGLSIYDLKTLKHKDFKIDLKISMGQDVFNSGKAVFIYDYYSHKMFLFTGSGFKKIDAPYVGTFGSVFFQGKSGSIFSMAEPNPFKKEPQVIFELKYINNSLKVLRQIAWDGSERNSISPTTNNGYWINSKNKSESFDHKIYWGYNTRKVVTDNEGNDWFISEDGLNVHYKETSVLNISQISEKIFSMEKTDAFFYLGAAGKILKFDIQQQKVVKAIDLPDYKWDVGFLKNLGSHQFMLQSNIINYLFNDSAMTFRKLGGATYLNNAIQVGKAIYLASSDMSFYYNIYNFNFDDTSLIPKQLIYKSCYNCSQSFSDVADIPENNMVVFAADNNLIEYGGGKTKYIKYLGKSISASALLYNHHKLFIASSQFGILEFENHLIRQLIGPENLGPERISKIQLVGRNLWLLNPGMVKILDPDSGKLIKNEFTSDYNVSDVKLYNNVAYFLSANKLYSVNLQSDSSQGALVVKNLFTVINGIDTLYNDNIVTAYNKNDYQFNLSFPVFRNQEKTRFRYRLIGVHDTKWKLTHSPDGIIRFASLMPGQYKFEALAIHPYRGSSQNLIVCSFVVLPPLWDTWWFKMIAIILIFLITAILIRIYYKSKLSSQRMFFENELAVEKERQRISREIHDDIGQSLSVIKLNLNMGAPAQLQEAKAIISEVIKDLRELTHTLYFGKPLLYDLVTSIRNDVTRLNAANQIYVTLEVTGNQSDLKPEQEVNIYRIYKEAINNILKHADAKNIELVIFLSVNKLVMTISDNGKGFEPVNSHEGIGISNMQNRAMGMGGNLTIDSVLGKGTKIRLVVPVKGGN